MAGAWLSLFETEYVVVSGVFVCMCMCTCMYVYASKLFGFYRQKLLCPLTPQTTQEILQNLLPLYLFRESDLRSPRARRLHAQRPSEDDARRNGLWAFLAENHLSVRFG